MNPHHTKNERPPKCFRYLSNAETEYYTGGNDPPEAETACGQEKRSANGNHCLSAESEGSAIVLASRSEHISSSQP